MYRLPPCFFSILIVISFSMISCREVTSTKTELTQGDTISPQQDQLSEAEFPKDWVGVYVGDMKWYANGKLSTTIPLTVEIQPIDSLENTYLWRSTYDSTETIPYKTVKNYWVLKPDSLAKHEYIMDERNGILLDMSLINNTFYTSFEVGTNRIFSSNRLVGDKLYHEIVMSPTTRTRQSYAIENKDTFFVVGLQQIVIQKAILTLQK